MTAETAEPLADSIEPLTEVQERTLKVIKKLRDEYGSFPTYKELAEELGITATSAYDGVSKLVKKGYVSRREQRKSRSLKIVVYPFDE
jgi:Mn-dependent DtxR family transcriptional regulator